MAAEPGRSPCVDRFCGRRAVPTSVEPRETDKTETIAKSGGWKTEIAPVVASASRCPVVDRSGKEAQLLLRLSRAR